MFFKDVTRSHIYSLITYSDLNQQQTEAAQARAHNARSYYAYVYAYVQRNVTCGPYYYITIKFDYAKRDSSLAAYGGVVFQRFEFIKRFVWERIGFAGNVNSAHIL